MKRSYKIIGPLLALVAMLSIACSSAPAAEPGINEDQLRTIVESAVAQSAPAPQQQVSAAEIQGLVESAIAQSAPDSATPQEIQAMVKSAVEAATADALTGSDVQSAVESAVMEAQSGMVTAEDVEAAVEHAVMEAQEGMVTAEDIDSAVSSAVMQAASNSLTADEIEAIVSQALEDRAMAAAPEKETIIFSDLNWTSAQVQNRVGQYIVENGYGYPTDTIFGGTLPNFEGLKKGDIHVAYEIWLPNQSIGWEKAIEIGDVVSVGTSLVGDWQSTFVIPQYLADEYPDLKTPQDLMKPEYQDLFSTADSRGKARHVACVIGWSCEQVNSQQIETYGLTDSLHVINPGSQEAMFAELFTAYEKEEPWLGYMWGTGDPALNSTSYDLKRKPTPQSAGKATRVAHLLSLSF